MNRFEITNIVLAGVGGQGIILAGKILAEVAFQAGLKVKANELHGMAQRGGSVTSHIRFGPEVFSPLVGEGEADFLVALEELEGLRQAHFLKPGGVAILNQRRIKPAGPGTGQPAYPEGIGAKLAAQGCQVREVKALEIARKIGAAKVENVVLLGALAGLLDFPDSLWQEAIRRSVPDRTVELNLRAFSAGLLSE